MLIKEKIKYLSKHQSFFQISYALIAFSLIFFVGTTNGQNMPVLQDIKSLKQKLQDVSTPEEKVKFYAQIGMYYHAKSFQADSSLYYFNEMLQYSMNNNYLNGQIEAHRYLGRRFTILGNSDQGMTHLKRSLHLADSINYQNSISDTYLSIGENFSKRNQYDSSIYYLQIALEKSASEKPARKAAYQTTLATSFQDVGDFINAQKYHELALTNYKKSEKPVLIYIGHTELAHFYANFSKSAKDYAFHLQKCKKMEKDFFEENQSYHSSTFYVEEMSINEKIPFLIQAIEYHKQNSYPDGITRTYLHIMESLMNVDDLRRALQFNQEALAYIQEHPETSLGDQSEINFMNSKIQEELGRYKEALQSIKIHNALEDSIQSINNYKTIQELNIKYETTLKEKLLVESQIEVDKKTSQRNIFLLSSIFLLLAGVLFWRRYKQQQLLNEKEHLIREQKIQQLEKEKKILSLAAMLEGQEAERIRIAKDLHDGLGGLLSTVKAHFGKIQKEIQKLESMQIYNKATGMIDEACDEVRRISHNMMPGVLRANGLKVAVEQIANELRSAHQLKVDYEFIGDQNRMNETTEVFIYRIIQELTNNIVKHAAANSVLIQLIKSEKEIQILVEDNGKGFDLKKAKEKEGLGIKSLISRIDFLNGTYEIDAREGEGTSVSVNVPLVS